jgi:hypothetical protein
VKDEKPLWRAGITLSGPVIVISAAALVTGAINRQMFRLTTLRGLMLIMMALSVLALGMLLWRMRRGSRRLRRWDVRLSLLGNILVLILLGLAFFLVHPSDSTESDIGAPRSAVEIGTP